MNNRGVITSPEQIVEEYRKASRRLRRRIKEDPTEARRFLIRAGIAEECRPSSKYPNGIRLVKELR
jgi:hypothetical protein